MNKILFLGLTLLIGLIGCASYKSLDVEDSDTEDSESESSIQEMPSQQAENFSPCSKKGEVKEFEIDGEKFYMEIPIECVEDPIDKLDNTQNNFHDSRVFNSIEK